MSQQVVYNRDTAAQVQPLSTPETIMNGADGGLNLSLVFNLSASSLLVIIIAILIGLIILIIQQ